MAAGRREVRVASVAGTARYAPEVSASHQHLDGLMTDLDPVTQRQLGVYAARAVDAAEVGMDLVDEFSEPRVTQSPLRRGAVPLRVETRLRYA
jgi:hypothetical protein